MYYYYEYIQQMERRKTGTDYKPVPDYADFQSRDRYTTTVFNRIRVGLFYNYNSAACVYFMDDCTSSIIFNVYHT